MIELIRAAKKKENLTNNKGSKKPQKEKSSEGITSSEKLKQKPQKEKSSEGITSSVLDRVLM